MKTILVAMMAIAGMASAAQAGGSATRAAATPKVSNAMRACEHADREGFCGLTLAPAIHTAIAAPATLNDQGRAQLNRLIASLR